MWSLVKDAFTSFARHGGRLLAGAIAFYALLSMAPIMVIALYVSGRVASEAAAREELALGLGNFLGREGADTALALLDRFHASGSGPLLSVVNGAVLLYASTRLFSQLKRSLNFMWDVEELPRKGLKTFVIRQVQKRLVAVVMVLLVCVLLLASVLFKTALTVAGDVVGATMTARRLWQAVELGASFVVVTIIFAGIYKLLPDVRIAWRDAWIGALATALLFTVGTLLIGVYLGHTTVGSTFGAAGSVVMLLLWVHYSAQVFFLGAAFTSVWARSHGRGLLPTAHARPRPAPERGEAAS
jgi:membrane protein